MIPLIRINRPPARRSEPTARREITNYKHHLILKLGQINSKLQYPNFKQDQNQLFGILNFSHCDLFEIWFDGGQFAGGPDLVSLLKELQPNSILYKGFVRVSEFKSLFFLKARVNNYFFPD